MSNSPAVVANNPIEVVPPIVMKPVESFSPRTFDNRAVAMDWFNTHFIYVQSLNCIVRVKDLMLYDPQTFVRAQFKPWKYRVKHETPVESTDENGVTTTITKVTYTYLDAAKAWFESSERRQCDGMSYVPGSYSLTPKGMLNRWKDWPVKSIEGEIAPWTQLLDFLFGGATAERKYFDQWLAYPLQHPGTKLMTAIILYSETQGLGKNILARAMQRIYGVNSKLITERDLMGSFNSWQRDKQFNCRRRSTGRRREAEEH